MIPFQKLNRMALAVAATVTIGSVQAAQLEEIVVTAQKRTESLQDVPISITTLDGAKIDQVGIANLEDLSAYVPNLMLSENAVATSIILRGVGPGANQSYEQSVGLFVDGVHLPKGRQTRTGLFDLERVEVLRGPQGTLFGKNTLAGAVNVTSATPRPGDETSGKLSYGVQSHDGQTIEAAIAGSIGDNFAMRFAFKDHEDDGYLTNSLIGGVDGPTTDETLWRLSATWQPSDNTTVEFKHAEGEHKRVGGTAIISELDRVQNVGAATGLAFAVINAFFPSVAPNVASGAQDPLRDAISLGGNALAASLGRGTVPGEKPEGTDTENSDTSLNIEHEFDNGMTFTSVTGYSQYEYEDGIDADFLPIRFIGRSDISEFDQFSQEFRLASDPSEKFSYITGAYFTNGTQEIDRVVAFDGTLGLPTGLTPLIGFRTLLAVPATTTAALGLPFGVNGFTSFDQIGRVSNWKQETTAMALFFQGEYQITDNLSLTAGLRYTEEDKDAYATTRITDDTSGLATPSSSPFVGPTIRGVAPTTFDHSFVDSRSTDQVIPAINLKWNKSDESQFYISYSEGFKSGGFNAVDDQAPNLEPGQSNVVDGLVHTVPGTGWSYEDETAKSLEIGGKHTLADGSMNLNWALFTSDYDDQQISTFVGIGFEVRNAASSNVDGLEIDWRWQATDNLMISANVALLDASYGSFPRAGCTALQQSAIAGGATSFDGCTVNIIDGRPVANQDLAGAPLTHAPDYSGSLSVSYDRPIGDNWNYFLGVDVNFTDDYLLTGDLDPLDQQAGFEKVNFQTGFRSDSWEFMVFGRNVTDELTASGGFDVPLLTGSHAIYTDPGEVYGARVTFKF